MLLWSGVCKITVPRATLQCKQPPSVQSNTSDRHFGRDDAPGQPQARAQEGMQGCAVSQATSSAVQVLTFQHPEKLQKAMSFTCMSVPPQEQHILPRDLALAAANIHKGRRKKTTTRKQKPSYAAEGE